MFNRDFKMGQHVRPFQPFKWRLFASFFPTFSTLGCNMTDGSPATRFKLRPSRNSVSAAAFQGCPSNARGWTLFGFHRRGGETSLNSSSSNNTLSDISFQPETALQITAATRSNITCREHTILASTPMFSPKSKKLRHAPKHSVGHLSKAVKHFLSHHQECSREP